MTHAKTGKITDKLRGPRESHFVAQLQPVSRNWSGQIQFDQFRFDQNWSDQNRFDLKTLRLHLPRPFAADCFDNG